jgi:hypothetical protein
MSVFLTPLQSITIHGWTNPKRILTWKDMCENKEITLELCSMCGVGDEKLQILQPSLSCWIEERGVSFKDVKYMTKWPLHPLKDLNGYIPDLIANNYEASLLHKLGIDYKVLVSMNMTIEWMKMFKFSEKEWVLLGFNPESMSERDLGIVFGMDRTKLRMIFASYA